MWVASAKYARERERHKHRGFLHQVAINPPASKNNHQKSTQHGSTRQASPAEKTTVLEFFSATKSWQSRPTIPRKTTCRSIRTPNEFAPNRDGRAMPESSATTEFGTRSRPMHPIAMRVSMSDAAIFAIRSCTSRGRASTTSSIMSKRSPCRHYYTTCLGKEIAPVRARTGRRKVVEFSKSFEAKSTLTNGSDADDDVYEKISRFASRTCLLSVRRRRSTRRVFRAFRPVRFYHRLVVDRRSSTIAFGHSKEKN